MADHAEIEQRNAIAGQAQQVAGMGVAVETPVHHHHVEDHVCPQFGDRGGLDTGCAQIVGASRRDARNIIHHEHRARGPLPVHLGHHNARVTSEIGAQAIGVSAFLGEVEFLQHSGSKLPQHRRRGEAPCLRARRLDHGRHLRDQPQVGLHARPDAGALHLQHDIAPIVQSGAVNLRDRGGGKRRLVQPRERGFRRLAKRLLQRGAYHRELQRRRLAVQLLKFGYPRRRQQIAARRQNLAELDEGRPEFLQREPGPHRQAQIASGFAVVGFTARQSEPGQQYAQPESGRDLENLGQTGAIAASND